MQAHYPFVIEREMGCSVAELRAWLPGASRDANLQWREHGVDIAYDSGCIAIDWHALEPRRIALIVLPRLQVRFTASAIPEEAWQHFMRYFDLYTQRGGG